MPPRWSGGPPWHRQGPPTWWPEGEQWPPERPLWERYRRRFRNRILVILGIFLILIVGIAGFIHNAVDANWESRESDGPPFPWFAPFFWIGIVVLIVWIVRRLRRTVAPIADIMDATWRVAEGDYSVRVNAPGPADIQGLANAFNTMAARLETNERQRTHLFSDIAHELRTPLAVVQGTIEGMLDGVYPKDDEHLAPMLDQTRVIARLLNDLQTIATAEAGALLLHREPTDLRELIADVIASFTPAATKDGIELRSNLTTTPELDIDPVRIRQVLDNLVANALRYTPEGGHVTLSLNESAGDIEIEVRDTGRGMAPEEVGRMFERFAKSADSGGSGLGLAIAKSLVEAHGGSISGASSPATGTTITITLPTTRTI